MNTNPIFLSIVVPVFNESAVLPQFFQELERVCSGVLADAGSGEIILVDDGSKDASWQLIVAQCRRNPAFVGIKLSRNFGHQLALAAELLAAHRQGFDVVYATRAGAVYAAARRRWCKSSTERRMT